MCDVYRVDLCAVYRVDLCLLIRDLCYPCAVISTTNSFYAIEFVVVMCPVLSVLCGSVPAVCLCSVCLSGSVVLSVSTHLHASALAICICFRHLSVLTVLCFCREEREEREEGEARCARFTVGFLGLLFVCC